MTETKIYVQSLLDICLLLFATLADIDMEIRITTGLVGIALALMTCVKLGLQIKGNAMDNKIKRIELKRKQAADEQDFELNNK